ncbi:class I SAM-dependent methyltransferase [Brevibacterium samyangense]|uniref:Class I SAM-dependent methyltransferase n=1 Tax=Brevibacterium samyangense TaxID=366888 RepID=A0ABN2TEL0_9MICO
MATRLPRHADAARARSFGAVAADYDASRPRYPDELLEDIRALGARTALDVGTGTGILAEHLHDLGLTVTGVDPDPAMADLARSKGFTVEQGTFEDWDPAGRAFDLITFGTSWHWVNPTLGAPKLAGMLRTPKGSVTPDGGDAEPRRPPRRTAVLAWNRLIPPAEVRTVIGELERVRGFDWHADTKERADHPETQVAPAQQALGNEGLATEMRTYLRRARYTREQWLAHIFTISQYNVLPDSEKQALRAEIEAAGLPEEFDIDVHTITLWAWDSGSVMESESSAD